MGVGAVVHQLPSLCPKLLIVGLIVPAAYLLGVLSTGTLVTYFKMFTEREALEDFKVRIIVLGWCNIIINTPKPSQCLSSIIIPEVCSLRCQL